MKIGIPSLMIVSSYSPVKGDTEREKLCNVMNELNPGITIMWNVVNGYQECVWGELPLQIQYYFYYKVTETESC